MTTLTGIGELFHEEQLVATGRYRVEVVEPTAMKLGHIEGVVNLNPATSFTLITSNNMLTLHLEDGRRWDCFLQNSDGRLVNRGQGLYSPL